MMNSNEKNINRTLFNKILVSVLSQEKTNVKTKKKSDKEMVEVIRKIIQTEVDNNDN